MFKSFVLVVVFEDGILLKFRYDGSFFKKFGIYEVFNYGLGNGE